MPEAVKADSAVNRFHAVGKDPAWHTSFYYLAEQLREMTDGALNHKALYALICPERRYINHANPTVRKRAAGTLSRIIHSKRYARDLREAYLGDQAVFGQAASEACAAICEAQGFGDAELRVWLVDECWPTVRQGLVNEAEEWRSDLDLFRLDREMSVLFSARREGEAAADAKAVLASMVYVMAFDHLDVDVARSLMDACLEDGALASPDREQSPDSEHACLIRFSDSARTMFSGFWTIAKDAPFVIGRYTDCDAIELSADVSCVHCRIQWDNGAWQLEDASSRNGSKVRRGDAYASAAGCDGGLHLEFGDAIELPGGSVYLFASMAEHAQFA